MAAEGEMGQAGVISSGGRECRPSVCSGTILWRPASERGQRRTVDHLQFAANRHAVGDTTADAGLRAQLSAI